jgi:hypothetical protein
MSCNIVFDFVDSHKSEYWYRCTHCHATEWFAHYGRPAQDKPIKGCNPSYIQHLPDPEDMTREQLIKEVSALRKYNHKLQQFEERVYTIYPDMAVTLQEKYND